MVFKSLNPKISFYLFYLTFPEGTSHSISLLFFSLPAGPFPSKWSFILAALRNHMGSLPKITKTQANELPMPHPLSLITVAFLLDLEIPFLAHLLRIKTKIINRREGRLHRLPRKEAPGLLLALLMLFCFYGIDFSLALAGELFPSALENLRDSEKDREPGSFLEDNFKGFKNWKWALVVGPLGSVLYQLYLIYIFAWGL